MKQNNTNLQVKIQSWDKQQYELYDTQVGQYITSYFEISAPGFFYRNNQDNQTYFSTDFELIQEIQKSEDYKILFVVKVQEECFFVGSLKHHHIGEVDDLWIRTNNNHSNNIENGFYQIKRNDIIKVGKKALKLVEINIEGITELETYGQISYFDSFYSAFDTVKEPRTTYSSKESKEQSQEQRQCRICLGSTHNHENPLVSICKCSGSMMYIHYLCAQTWIQSKEVKKFVTQYQSEIKIKSIRCELCLKTFPTQFSVENTVYNLYSLNTSDSKNYLIFEDEDGSLIITKFLLLHELILGRGYQSQIKISEITVSRDHLSLRLKGNKVYIKDLNSKFGTLIKLQKLKNLNEEDQLQLQSGRTLIDLKVPKVPKSLLPNLCNYRFCH